MLEVNKIYNMDCLDGMKLLDDECIDLTVTSPPYDNLRTYNGFSFDFEGIAKELYRVTKKGGVVVWVVDDAIIDGSKTGTSFKQALYFKEVGFNFNDTMIWAKSGFNSVGNLQSRYPQTFEYMFVFSKGKPKCVNLLKDRKNKWAFHKRTGTKRLKDGTFRPISNVGKPIDEYGPRFNVWMIDSCRQEENFNHPAPFPEQIANDHIQSWTEENDIIMDPFMGSGTTSKMAIVNNRKFIGFEISKEYCDIAERRIDYLLRQTTIFTDFEQIATSEEGE